MSVISFFSLLLLPLSVSYALHVSLAKWSLSRVTVSTWHAGGAPPRRFRPKITNRSPTWVTSWNSRKGKLVSKCISRELSPSRGRIKREGQDGRAFKSIGRPAIDAARDLRGGGGGGGRFWRRGGQRWLCAGGLVGVVGRRRLARMVGGGETS